MKRKTISFILFFLFFLFFIPQFFYGIEITDKPVSVENKISVLVPSIGEKSYKIAGESFTDLWEKVTGQRLTVSFITADDAELPEGDVILIGSDAVNPIVHNMIRTGTLEDLGTIVYFPSDKMAKIVLFWQVVADYQQFMLYMIFFESRLVWNIFGMEM